MVRVHFGPPLTQLEVRVKSEEVTFLQNLFTVHYYLLLQIWGVSSAGRAPALQAGGHRFDPGTLHHQV